MFALPQIDHVILGSASPRRRELLSQLHIPFKVVTPEIDETPRENEQPKDYAKRVACEKAKSIFQADTPIITADTVVVLDDQLLLKPRNQEEATNMLLRLSGRTHLVLTAICVRYNEQYVDTISESKVTFRKITTDEAVRYWQTGEPQDKAGAYAVQGQGAVFITHLDGSYSGVMGLPLYETYQLLAMLNPVNQTTGN